MPITSGCRPMRTSHSRAAGSPPGAGAPSSPSRPVSGSGAPTLGAGAAGGALHSPRGLGAEPGAEYALNAHLSWWVHTCCTRFQFSCPAFLGLDWSGLLGLLALQSTGCWSAHFRDNRASLRSQSVLAPQVPASGSSYLGHCARPGSGRRSGHAWTADGAHTSLTGQKAATAPLAPSYCATGSCMSKQAGTG
jgi:hypothetical protein